MENKFLRGHNLDKNANCGCKFVATNLNHKNANWGFCVDTLAYCTLIRSILKYREV